MAYAALTFVYNEGVNLPIWVKYYGTLFGPENLFIIDRSSDDESTSNLGKVNVVKIPRNAFDEVSKTRMMSSFHSALTSCYEAVVVTDCDEIVVPDPSHFVDLNVYINNMDADHVNAVGIDVIHILNEESPLDLRRTILSQRLFGRFHGSACKALISRVPTKWLPGLHSCDRPPNFDERLFIIHLKLMDYGIAVLRQRVNLETEWSDASLKIGHGSHHRLELSKFVKQFFLAPMNLINEKQIGAFEFRAELEDLAQRTVIDKAGNYRVPTNVSKMIVFPDRFAPLI